MQISNVAPGAKGSFGIPQQIKDAGDRLMKKDETEERPGMEDAAALADDPVPEIPVEEAPQEPSTPRETLAQLGIDLSDEDLNRYVFRRYVDKEIEIYPSFTPEGKGLTATIKTLTAKEYDLADELLAEDIRDIKMTNDGYSSRRSMWIISFGVTKLMGAPLCKPLYLPDNKKELDLRAMAIERRRILSDMAPDVVNDLIQAHGVLTITLRTILQDKRSDYLKKFSPPRKA